MSTPCVKIKWTDPPDILTNEPVPATWAGTVIVRKEGSAPLNRYDGTEIEDSTTRDEYASTALVDDTIQSDKDYYYGIFPYDTNGHVRFTKVVRATSPARKTIKSFTHEETFSGEVWLYHAYIPISVQPGLYFFTLQIDSPNLPSGYRMYFGANGESAYYRQSEYRGSDELLSINLKGFVTITNQSNFVVECYSTDDVNVPSNTKVNFTLKMVAM